MGTSLLCGLVGASFLVVTILVNRPAPGPHPLFIFWSGTERDPA